VAQLKNLDCRVTDVAFIMKLMRIITASVLGSGLLSSRALALGQAIAQKEDEPGATNVSSAKCTVVSIGYSEGKTQELIVTAGGLSSPRPSEVSQHLHITSCVWHQFTHQPLAFACMHVLHNHVDCFAHNRRNFGPHHDPHRSYWQQ
jgi:hypothetical protein